MTTPVNPVPGFSPASPRTWSAGDQVTTPRLRASMYNLAALYAQGRPIFASGGDNVVATTAQQIAEIQFPNYLNTWNVVLGGTASYYQVPLSGWYLVSSFAGMYAAIGGGGATSLWENGVLYITGTAQSQIFMTSSSMIGNPSANSFGISSATTDLMALNSATDSVAIFGQGASVIPQIDFNWSVEWVGLPTLSLISGGSVTVPVGTVVTSPKPASLWPAGGGVTLGGSVAAGGTVLSLPPTPGLRTGQVIGLDWQNGQQAQVYAELGTVSSIAGTAVTLSGTTSFAHAAGAPVAVPVSAALLNEQVRDQSNFWFYPPMLRAISGTQQTTLVNATWTTVNLSLAGNGINTTLTGQTVDNFSGFSGNTYTVQVSGVYLIAGTVFFLNMTGNSAMGAALLVSGTLYIGEVWGATGGSGFGLASSVRRVLRLTAGQTIVLQGFQNNGSNLNTNNVVGGTPQQSRLIVVMRSF